MDLVCDINKTTLNILMMTNPLRYLLCKIKRVMHSYGITAGREAGVDWGNRQSFGQDVCFYVLLGQRYLCLEVAPGLGGCQQVHLCVPNNFCLLLLWPVGRPQHRCGVFRHGLHDGYVGCQLPPQLPTMQWR